MLRKSRSKDRSKDYKDLDEVETETEYERIKVSNIFQIPLDKVRTFLYKILYDASFLKKE